MQINAGGTAGIFINYSSREYFTYSRDFLFCFGIKQEENSMYRTLYCNDICDKHIGQTVQLAGWVDVVRDHGGVIFVDIRDYTGVTQVVIHDENLVKNVNRETVISVSGIVEKRDPDTVNEKIATGYVELVADSLQILGKSKNMLPFDVRASRQSKDEVRLNSKKCFVYMISKILVANRGEIAMRVMRSCKEMGIKTVAVYSEADRTSRHVFFADEAVCIGPAQSAESYLKIDNIIEAAKKFKADAIHPGYGFLSENADFAERCEKEGIIFIGAPYTAIRAMGDKISARKLMISAGVPVVPGTEQPLQSYEEALSTAKEIGLPVMIKASAGGGGKGIRIIRELDELKNAYESAISEATASFANGIIYMEKLIEQPHHIEFQVLADKHGNAVHLYERECSIQRKHQKVIEETPSPYITDKIRHEMGEIAVRAAKAVAYEGAGTIEFLVDKDMNYYFLEMNTRLQVEHPITEEVLGVDLVKEQINVANGNPLRFKQEDLSQRGHAIECRICAEDAENGFVPTPGIIKLITEPQGIGVRVDSFCYEGYEIPIYYDAMLSKLVVWAANRTYAIERMRRVLFEYKITGTKTNISYLRKILEVPDFVNGHYTTSFLEDNKKFLENVTIDDESEDLQTAEDIAAIAAYFDYMINEERSGSSTSTDNRPISRWREFGKRSSMRNYD